MCTYEDLVDATLPARPDPARGAAAAHDHPRRRGHRPRHRVDVVPQRAAARVGAGDGRLHRRRRGGHRTAPDNEHADLFATFPNSYGSLGYATRLRIELEPVRSHVALRHVRFRDTDGPAGRDRRRSPRPGEWDGERVDALDGIAFEPGEYYLTLAQLDRRAARLAGLRLRRAADLLALDPAAGDRPADDLRLPVALGHRLVLVLARVRRPAPAWCAGSGRAGCGAPTSTTGWSASSAASGSWTGSTAGPDRPQRERVVQDIEVPVERLGEFLDWFDARGRHAPGVAVPVAAARVRRPGDRGLAVVPAEAGAHLRQRRLLGRGARRRRRPEQPAATARSRTRSPSSTATSRSTPRRSTTPRPSTGSTTAPTWPR